MVALTTKAVSKMAQVISSAMEKVLKSCLGAGSLIFTSSMRIGSVRILPAQTVQAKYRIRGLVAG